MAETDQIPAEYAAADHQTLTQRIALRKRELGNRLVILGHHYQRDEVFQFADFTGDSLKLSRQAAEQADAEFIVFCGVHFMAESAEILSAPHQRVCLPNLAAGCAMADMAEYADVAAALDELRAMTDAPIVPVAYVNSTAAIKALTGRAGGACCTSSNVRKVFDWALRPAPDGGAGGRKVFAVPDQHLARNTAAAMGYDEADLATYDPHQPGGGLSAEDVERATFVLWQGHCYVHQLFTRDDVERARQDEPEATIMVHPECPRAVVDAADRAGSTEQIRAAVGEAAPGSRWVIGTESNMVERLAREHPDQSIRVLSAGRATCVQMARIDLPHLLWTLDAIAAGEPIHVIRVADDVADDARTALQRMIAI
ncbi:MAG: quinolinate synthase NadA [Phycisphaerae bacterium]|nr:quinolinate synthase NadA [Phycisphaerae bacterium]